MDTSRNISGGLHMQYLLDYILHLEDNFVKNFSVYTKSTTVTFPVEYMMQLFLRMHIYIIQPSLGTGTLHLKGKQKNIKLAHCLINDIF
jgi:hypothetical protein